MMSPGKGAIGFIPGDLTNSSVLVDTRRLGGNSRQYLYCIWLLLHYLRQLTLQPGMRKANEILVFLVRFQDFKQALSFHSILSLYLHKEGLPDRNICSFKDNKRILHDFSFKGNPFGMLCDTKDKER